MVAKVVDASLYSCLPSLLEEGLVSMDLDGVEEGGGGGANCCAILLASYPRHSKSFSRAFGSKMSAMKVQVRLSAEVFAVATLASQNAA